MRILQALVLAAGAMCVHAQTAPQTAPPAARTSLSDVAALRRYAGENAKLAPPAANEDRVVFMGDSITDFWGRRYGKFFPGRPYINRGISGQVTPQMLLRFRQDVIALQPRIVVILGGTNDIGGSLGPIDPEATHANIMSMVDLARAHGIRVVLSSMTPVCDYISPQTPKRPMEKLAKLNQWMKEYAASNGIVYLDYWPAMLDEQGMLRKELTWDGLHPNDAGYDVMGPLAEKAIEAALKTPFPEGARILFQGDSITDGNRGRTADPNHILGHSYAYVVAAKYGAESPGRHWTFLNRGISGNTVADLLNRWQNDTIALKPDVLSILIGVNDLGRGVSVEDYEKQYDQLLAETVKALPNVGLVLGEPFGLPAGRFRDTWQQRRAELEKRQAVVAKLAARYHAVLVHYQKAFDEAARRAPADYWIWDGVHPTYSGHQIMAEEWMKAVQ